MYCTVLFGKEYSWAKALIYQHKYYIRTFKRTNFKIGLLVVIQNMCRGTDYGGLMVLLLMTCIYVNLYVCRYIVSSKKLYVFDKVARMYKDALSPLKEVNKTCFETDTWRYYSRVTSNKEHCFGYFRFPPFISKILSVISPV